MLKILKTRFKQGCRTLAFPKAPAPALPERYRGRPIIAGQKGSIDLGAITFNIAIRIKSYFTKVYASLSGDNRPPPITRRQSRCRSFRKKYGPAALFKTDFKDL